MSIIYDVFRFAINNFFDTHKEVSVSGPAPDGLSVRVREMNIAEGTELVIVDAMDGSDDPVRFLVSTNDLSKFSITKLSKSRGIGFIMN